MEAVNDQDRVLKELVEAAMAAVGASGQLPATTPRPLNAVAAVLEASGVTGMVTEAAAGIITDTVSKISSHSIYLKSILVIKMCF